MCGCPIYGHFGRSRGHFQAGDVETQSNIFKFSENIRLFGQKFELAETNHFAWPALRCRTRTLFLLAERNNYSFDLACILRIGPVLEEQFKLVRRFGVFFPVLIYSGKLPVNVSNRAAAQLVGGL